MRGWFKNNNFTPEAVAAAFMTGILPIKKDGSQSVISDFVEYSMIDSGEFAEFAGFTEEEVRRICEEKHLDFEQMRKWYDGYTVARLRAGESITVYTDTFHNDVEHFTCKDDVLTLLVHLGYLTCCFLIRLTGSIIEEYSK